MPFVLRQFESLKFIGITFQNFALNDDDNERTLIGKFWHLLPFYWLLLQVLLPKANKWEKNKINLRQDLQLDTQHASFFGVPTGEKKTENKFDKFLEHLRLQNKQMTTRTDINTLWHLNEWRNEWMKELVAEWMNGKIYKKKQRHMFCIYVRCHLSTSFACVCPTIYCNMLKVLFVARAIK